MSSPYPRRQFLIGGAALATAGVAFAAEPRRDVADFSKTPLTSLVPGDVAGWTGADSGDVVPEQVDGSIDHGQTLNRLYAGAGLSAVMLVVSYHGPQSPDLKVHRPETCYRVAGFEGGVASPTLTPLAGASSVPSVGFTAKREQRVETVLYWTRVGNLFPQTLTGQRLDFLREALRGVRADGLLMRASTIGDDREASMATLKRFAASLVTASSPPGRRLLLGPQATALGRS